MHSIVFDRPELGHGVGGAWVVTIGAVTADGVDWEMVAGRGGMNARRGEYIYI